MNYFAFSNAFNVVSKYLKYSKTSIEKKSSDRVAYNSDSLVYDEYFLELCFISHSVFWYSILTYAPLFL